MFFFKLIRFTKVQSPLVQLEQRKILKSHQQVEETQLAKLVKTQLAAAPHTFPEIEVDGNGAGDSVVL